MALSAEQAALARRLGHDFAEPTLLQQALTHPSMASPVRPHNQRLEFLGDRVLNLAIAEALFAADAGAAEGELAIRYNELVRKETCAEIAREIGLGDVLRLSRGERLTSGRRKTTTLGDALEAVIAAIYLDAGFARAREVVLRLWGDRVHEVRGQARDPKTALQEWAQARRQPPPAYREVAREGPDHAPVFTVEVALESGETARAAASAKRVAEQAAAEALLARLVGETP